MIALTLHESVMRGSAPVENVSDALRKTWRRSIKRIGGYWIGTAEVSASDVGRNWLDELFFYGFLREIRERGTGREETWRGSLVKMEYNRGGDTFIKDAIPMFNAVRSIYTRIGDNLLTNGSGESGAWTAYNGATVTQTTAFVTQGTYGMSIVVADTTIRGATIQATIAVTAGVQYIIRCALRIVSGSWRFSTNRADNDQSLAFFSSHEVGDHSVNITIDATNTYTGNVDLRITSEAAAGTIYADAAVFQTGPTRAETTWYSDTASIAEWGRKENVLLRAGKSDDDANAECQTELVKWSWPNPTPPTRSRTFFSLDRSKDKLKLTFAGYWAMLNWLYTTLAGTNTASNWVTALTALQSTYIASSSIDTNAMDFYVDDRAPLKIGDLLRDIAVAGDSSGNKWSIGVYETRRLIYEQVSAELTYRRKGCKLLTVSQDEIEPWLARPGWALWEDLPIGPGQISGYAQHDPRWVYLDTIEMLPDGSLEFELERLT